MRLRARLTVATVAAVVPLIVVLIWLDARARHRAAEEALADVTLRSILRPGERERCESDPAGWGGKPMAPPDERGPGPGPGPAPDPSFRRARDDRPHGAPPVLFAFDRALHASHPRAPALDDALVAGIAEAEVATVESTWPGSAVEVLVRTPWATGACAYVYARGTTEPGWIGAILPASRLWMVPMFVVLAAVLVAMGPAVRRIRRLTRVVRASAAAGFTGAVAVDGDDEIAELGRAFDAASREVRTQLAARDRREQALREFLANTTHDVMIPLTVLQAHLATLQERAAAGAPVEASVVTSAMDEAHYMASMIHNLGIAAKLDAGEPALHRTSVDLLALIARVLARHRPIARQLGVELESAVPEASLAADADVTLLEQAISNVVYNAIRHNRSGGHVAVILEATAPAGFRVRVVDDGPGIPAADLARLVERGFRGDDARTRAPGGSGLGLHIAWRVAQLHALALRFAASEYGGLEVTLEGAAVGPAIRAPA
jgi:signal transduction histidine kinase